MNSSFSVPRNPWILICLGREYRTVRYAGEDLHGYEHRAASCAVPESDFLPAMFDVQRSMESWKAKQESYGRPVKIVCHPRLT
jgi:hypothetical protein